MLRFMLSACFFGSIYLIDKIWRIVTTKIFVRIFIILIAIATLGVFIGIAFFTTPYSTPDLEFPVFLEIPQGATSGSIAQILQKKGLLKYPTLFKLYSRFSSKGNKLRAGRHVVRKPMSIIDFISKLSSEGGSYDVKVTVPEGWTIYQIAEILHTTMGFDTTDFYTVVKDKKLLDSLGLDVPTMEGFLYPETYFFPENFTIKQVVLEMYAHFAVMWSKKIDKAKKYGRPMEDVITLASIIESEASVGFERRTISSVYNNRLRINMLMQADPTTIYAIRKFDKPLILKDLRTENPYNTYWSKGLPPGPICNPSEACIDAAMNPETSKLLYFVARPNGTHIFTKTLQDHHKAIREIRGPK